jgi:hypothetical protein
MPTGTTTVNFGAFPGATEATAVITGQTGILSNSMVEAWLYPIGGTADHSEDEHVVDPPIVTVSTLVVGTGFTIRVIADPVDVPPPLLSPRATRDVTGAAYSNLTPMPYGLWQVAWAWA